jgi:glycosidase
MILLSLLSTPLFGGASDQASFTERPIEDDVFYFIMVDRFANGDPSNDTGLATKSADISAKGILRHGFWPEDKGYYHGGDFKGIQQKLDYLKDMGVTALWLSPIMKNQPVQGLGKLENSSAGYHGYWATDFTTVDPHYGTEDDFKELVDEAHKRGMKVYMDVITNHTADIISYRDCSDCPYRSVADFPYSRKKDGDQLNPGFNPNLLTKENYAKLVDPNYAYEPYVRQDPGRVKKPDWLNDVIYYHNRGNSTFSGESSELGDFFGLDDLFTEHPRVVEGMIDIYKEWIRKYRIDGFRVDTVKHVNIEFWREFVPAMRDYARKIGIPHFFVFGEVFSGDPEILSYYTREGRMDSVLDFAFHGAAKSTFADGKTKTAFQQTFSQDDLHRFRTTPQRMMSFVSNHDIGRIGRFIQNVNPDAAPETQLRKSLLAHAFMFFGRGIPVIYYGDEQGFTGDGGDKDAREDMFPSQVASYNDNRLIGTDKSTKVDNFDKSHPIYQGIRRFKTIYQQHELLRRGEQYEYPVGDQTHAFAFLRTLPDTPIDYLVAFNWGDKAVRIPWPRSDAEVIYPATGKLKNNEITVEPLDFAIVSGGKALERRRREQPRVVSPAADERVGTFFTFEIASPSSQYPQVDFAYQLKGAKQPIKLPTDYNRPYRAYIDASDFAQGQEVTLIAKVTDLQQKKPVVLKRNVIVDSREPTVNLHYANGNSRTHALYLTSTGYTSLFQPLAAKGQLSFKWARDYRNVLVVFGHDKETDVSHKIGLYDAPILIEYETIKQALEVSPDPLVADLYINNQHKVAYTKPTPEQNRPRSLKWANPVETERPDLYLRGGMNTWKATDQLEATGPYSYATTVELGSGPVEFKIADKDWQAASNFGTPIGPNGLTASPQSGNLKFVVPEGEEGKYRFEFIWAPGSETQAGEDLAFLKVEAL